MKKLLLSFALLSPLSIFAQLSIDALGTDVPVDLSDYAGAGFQPGGGAGTLNSDIWSAEGFTDGAVDFGETNLTGDFARGIGGAGITTGGIYGLPMPDGNRIWIQPTNDDFTPGSMTLRLQNNTGITLGGLNIAYSAWASNDQERANSLLCSYSYDGVTFTPIPELDFISPEVSDLVLHQSDFSFLLTGITVDPAAMFYIRFTGDDVSGAGARDEFGISNISFAGFEPDAVPEYNFEPSDITIDESTPDGSFIFSISESADCSFSFGYDPAGTATPGFDFGLMTFAVDFTAGGPTSQEIIFAIVDDFETEIDETAIVYVTSVTGACIAGGAPSSTITIVDNDAVVPPIATFTTVGVDDDEAVGTITGTLEISETADCTIQLYLDGASTMENGLDYTFLLPTFLTFTEGGPTSIDFEIPIIDDLEVEPTEMLLINMLPWTGTCVMGAIGDFEINITDNDVEAPVYASFTFTGSEHNEGDGSTDIYVYLSEAADCTIEVTANASSTAVNGLDYSTTLPAEFTFTAGGATSQTLTIDIINDLEIEGDEALNLDMAVTSGACAIGLYPNYALDIIDDDFESIQQTSGIITQMYPNPAFELLNIQTDISMDNWFIYDINGKLIRNGSIQSREIQIDIHDLVAGTYQLRVSNANESAITNFVKQ
ncbi:MAG TPA: Calx-beta domain-containing protein [Chitinophagales bacterium]|nr:Calx-beta domain-containing protein [Chitinophagales bacterium]